MPPKRSTRITQRLDIAVLVLAYARVDTLRLVFDSIGHAPIDIPVFVSVDGKVDANLSTEQDAVVKLAKEFSTRGGREVTIWQQKSNLGIRSNLISSLGRLFRSEEFDAVIVLEDDCIPGTDFWEFICKGLVSLRPHQKIKMITGNNFLHGLYTPPTTAYFSKYPHIWGWATWRDRWNEIMDLEDVSGPRLRSLLLQAGESRFRVNRITRKFDQAQASKHIWDYQFMVKIWALSGIAAAPSVNLVENIGFGNRATHTKFESFTERVKPKPLPISQGFSFPEVIEASRILDRLQVAVRYILFAIKPLLHPIIASRRLANYLGGRLSS